MPNFYDLQKIKEISRGDDSFVEIIVATFVKEIPPDMEAMQVAMNNGNHKMVYQFAHKMKPNIDMLGIDLLKQITAVEKWSSSDKPASYIKPQLDNIIEVLTNALEELKEDFSV